MNNYKLLENVAFLRFIKEYNVEEGDIKVPNCIIYFEYKRHWKGQRKNDKINRIHFFRIFHHYFKKTWKEKSTRGFFLKAGSFDIGIDNLINARAFDRFSLAITGTNRGWTRKKYLVGENKRLKTKRDEIEQIKRETNINEKIKEKQN